ncbi:MAG: penicillin-binding protein 2 [Solirubrobacterales bacterium]|nr:penicillin-binding protein 2 [Solirubrobacterales bacterium]
MYLDRDDIEQPRRSQTAFRVAVLSGIALVMFSVIFFRLWYLQVLSGDRYLVAARNNQVRQIRTQAPRGDIVDRSGRILVDNRTALALQVQPTKLAATPAARADELRRLAPIAGMTPRRVRRRIAALSKELPQGPLTLRRGVPYDRIFYLQENQSRFPGVSIERVFVRRYKGANLAAQMFGNVGEVTAEQLKQPGYQRLIQGDIVGQSGLEYTYDRFLRGQAGATKIQVDALGRPKGQVNLKPAITGNTLQLTIDEAVQRAGERALASRGLPGGFVVMDVKTGEVLGLGSYPTFDPAVFTRSLTKATYRRLTSKATGAPLFNRAIGGAYPTGSTFKPITALAALNGGLITPSTIIVDGGSIKVGGIEFKNSGGGLGFGAIDLPTALKFSSDVFFYILGQQAEQKGEGIQKWAQLLGLGARTGIDLPGELSGLIPTPEWRNRLYRRHQTDRPWSVGDNINLAVGQGDLQADPLQMAVAYAAIANGGEVLRPHVGGQVEDAAGRVLQEIRPPPRRHVNIKPEYRQAILDGLHLAADSPGGTSYKVFGAFPTQIAGKTGTAERPGQQDQSWFVALAPYNNPRIVVAVTIERGGFGVDSAAPAAERILAQYFHVKPGQTSQSSPGAAAPVAPGVTAPEAAGRPE